VKLLLDTHIWIWSFLEPRKIARRVAQALQDPANEKWLSPISLWELIVLVQKRRVILNMAPEEWISEALRNAPIREAPLTTDVVLATNKIRLSHQDPADAFLAATAHSYGLTLVTSDVRLLSVKGLSSLANR
jgi:PIN domain nuclease of toxin-antitoxin system